MDNIENACLNCHSDTTEEQLQAQVDAIQDGHIEMMHETQWFSVRAHYYVNRMITAGADEEKIEEAQYEVRKGQWFWDIIAAENSDGFHNPQGGADSMRTSVEASIRAIKIAETELTGLGEDLDELERQIEETMENVYSEGDPHEKHTHAVNEYFPNVLELDY